MGGLFVQESQKKIFFNENYVINGLFVVGGGGGRGRGSFH